MRTIKGRLTIGYGTASGHSQNWQGKGTIYHQTQRLKEMAPYFAKKLAQCKMGTINVTTDEPISIRAWDYTFEQVAWIPNLTEWSETIFFSPIFFSLDSSGLCIPAWLYRAAKSPHASNHHLLEVIAPYIPDVASEKACTIKIEEKYLDAQSDARN
jgi:hypothetical protein